MTRPPSTPLPVLEGARQADPAASRVLFVHQNFPGQFLHLAAELARRGYEVVALGITIREVAGVRCVRYGVGELPHRSAMRLAADFEAKLLRGISCARAMEQLRTEGFVPDLVVAHPGWGEALFCKDVWPQARLLVFSEFFYSATGADHGFDPEFDPGGLVQRMNLRVKNTALLHALHACDLAYAPTQWQHSRVPREYRSKVDVIFDGIDTERLKPDAGATFTLPEGRGSLRAGEEVLTFVNRNLEPYRGFHTFMRALPRILQERPYAQCVLVGGDDVSYGRKPRNGANWREVLLREVGGRLPLERVHFVGRLTTTEVIDIKDSTNEFVSISASAVQGIVGQGTSSVLTLRLDAGDSIVIAAGDHYAVNASGTSYTFYDADPTLGGANQIAQLNVTTA